MNPKTVYMIRRKSDGLFSTGGMSPSFTKKGKVWATLGALKLHLNLATEQYGYYYGQSDRCIQLQDSFEPYADCEIVCFEMKAEEKETPFDIQEYFNTKLEAEGAKRAKWHPRKQVMVKFTDGTTKMFNETNDNDN